MQSTQDPLLALTVIWCGEETDGHVLGAEERRHLAVFHEAVIARYHPFCLRV